MPKSSKKQVTKKKPQYEEDEIDVIYVNDGNPCAVAAFVLSFIPFINIIALILAIIGLFRSGEVSKGKGLSIAAIIISLLALPLGILPIGCFAGKT